MSLDFFDELSREMWNLQRRSLEPLTSTSELEEKVIIEVDLPLVSKKNIKLRLINEGLEIEASLSRCVKFERWGTIQRSCEFRSFYKIVPLPHQVVPENAKATFKRGILRVELKKMKRDKYEIHIE